jgi:hypothetical protein
MCSTASSRHSIVAAPDNKRTELTTLPFYPLWERVKRDAVVAKEDNWLTAKANMAALYESLVVSPDLTPKQADALAEDFMGQMKSLHNRAVQIGNLQFSQDAAAPKPPDKLDEVRGRIADLLKS